MPVTVKVFEVDEVICAPGDQVQVRIGASTKTLPEKHIIHIDDDGAKPIVTIVALTNKLNSLGLPSEPGSLSARTSASKADLGTRKGRIQ